MTQGDEGEAVRPPVTWNDAFREADALIDTEGRIDFDRLTPAQRDALASLQVRPMDGGEPIAVPDILDPATRMPQTALQDLPDDEGASNLFRAKFGNIANWFNGRQIGGIDVREHSAHFQRLRIIAPTLVAMITQEEARRQALGADSQLSLPPKHWSDNLWTGYEYVYHLGSQLVCRGDPYVDEDNTELWTT